MTALSATSDYITAVTPLCYSAIAQADIRRPLANDTQVQTYVTTCGKEL